MATLILRVCDECGKETRRLVKIEDRIFCSRDCYLAVCKRIFDNRWTELLKELPIEEQKRSTFFKTPALSSIVERALQKQVEHRFQNAQQLLNELKAVQ